MLCVCLCVCVSKLPACVSAARVCIPGACGSQKRVTDLLEQGLLVVMKHHVYWKSPVLCSQCSQSPLNSDHLNLFINSFIHTLVVVLMS